MIAHQHSQSYVWIYAHTHTHTNTHTQIHTHSSASFGKKIFITCSNSNKMSEGRIPFLKWKCFYALLCSLLLWSVFYLKKHSSYFPQTFTTVLPTKVKCSIIYIRSIRFFLSIIALSCHYCDFGDILQFFCVWYWRHLWIWLCLKKSVWSHSVPMDKNHTIRGCVPIIWAVGKLKENFILH